MKKMLFGLMAAILFLSVFFATSNVSADSSNSIYYFTESKQKKDAAYNKDKDIKTSDVHYGWELGKFQITGFTRKQEMEDGSPLFIKNVGDTISLSFLLEQDITALNGEDNVFISEDTNGYDDYFGITKDNKTNFGLGTLLVKYTDYQNNITYFAPYVDYLSGVEQGAETDIQLFDEGDYEIALDYEVRKNNIDVWKVHTAPSYSHYQILIKFSVRNGNCMVYPFDVETNSELVNKSFTENGFYLDLAKSRYLTIDVKKLDFVETDGAFVEDVRFNKAASDGETFTDEGLYVITVHNKYTDNETEKKIYVGSDSVMKAYVTTGKDVEYIKEMVEAGAVIEDDGTITMPVVEVAEAETEVTETEEMQPELIEETSEILELETIEESKQESNGFSVAIFFAVIIAVVALIIIVTLWIVFKKTKSKES